jgi:hypothetical protein
MRVDHALRRAGGPRGQEQLGHRVGPDPVQRGPHGGPGRGGQELAEGQRLGAGVEIAHSHRRGHDRRERVERRAELSGVVGEHHARRAEARDRANPLVVLREQRVGHTHRDHRHTRREAGEHHHEVLERVAGQHHHRSIGAQPEVEEGLRERVGLRPRTAERQGATRAAGARLCGQHPLRVLRRPDPQHVRHAALVLAQHSLRPHQHRTVRALLEAHPRTREELGVSLHRHIGCDARHSTVLIEAPSNIGAAAARPDHRSADLESRVGQWRYPPRPTRPLRRLGAEHAGRLPAPAYFSSDRVIGAMAADVWRSSQRSRC